MHLCSYTCTVIQYLAMYIQYIIMLARYTKIAFCMMWIYAHTRFVFSNFVMSGPHLTPEERIFAFDLQSRRYLQQKDY
jgi:hypothetical protein